MQSENNNNFSIFMLFSITALSAIAAVLIRFLDNEKEKTAASGPQHEAHLVVAKKKYTTTAFAFYHYKVWQLRVKIIYVCYIYYDFVKPYKFSDVKFLLDHLQSHHNIVLHPSKGKRDPYFKYGEFYYKYVESNWDVVHFGCPS